MRIPFRKNKPQGRQPMNQAGKPRAAFSYYAGDAPRKQDNVKARARVEKKADFFKRLRLLPTLIALGAIVLSIVYSTTLSTTAGIKYAGEQSLYHGTAYYKKNIETILSSSIWNRSKLTINTGRTETALLKAFPEFDVATVTLPVVGRRPTVTIHVRQPIMILASGGKGYVLDRTGSIVALAEDLLSSTREKLPVLQDQSALTAAPGQRAMTSDSVAFILNALAQFKDKQLAVTSITLPVVPNEIDFRLKDTNYYIKTDATGDARIQIGAYLAARDNGLSASEYVDVRVEEKVFYK